MHCKYLPLFHTKPQKSFLRLCMGQREVLTVHAFFRLVMLVSKIRTRVQNQTLASKIRHYCRSSLGCVSRCSILQQGRSPIRSSQLSFTSSSKEDRRLGKGLTIFLVYCSFNNQMLTFSLLEQSEGLLCCSLSFHPILGLSSIVREVNFFFSLSLASLYYLL